MKKLFGILLIGLFLALPLAGDWYWNKYTGKLDYYERSTASPWFTTVYLYDLDMSNKLAISWPENDVADRTLRFYVNGGARIINLSGDFTLSGANQVGLWTVTSTLTANSTILQAASQYHNWGAVAGAGGYGFRDNAGNMEYKNSGGAWAGVGVGGGAHDILSATHTDSTAAAVVRGDIITGQGVAPKWTKLALGTANYLLGVNLGATDVEYKRLLADRCSVSLAGDQAIANGIDVIVAFDTEEYDDGANWNTGTYKFVCPVNGYYLVTGQAAWGSVPADTRYYAKIFLNANLYRSFMNATPAGIGSTGVPFSTIVKAVATDFIQVKAAHSDANPVNLYGGDKSRTFINVILIGL